jgi:hypothetical protein
LFSEKLDQEPQIAPDPVESAVQTVVSFGCPTVYYNERKVAREAKKPALDGMVERWA